MSKSKFYYLIIAVLLIAVFCTSCFGDKDTHTSDTPADTKKSVRKFSVDSLPPYKITQDTLNNKLVSSEFSYYDNLFFYTYDSSMGAQLAIGDLNDNSTLLTEWTLGLASYIWDGFLIVYSTHNDNSCIDVMNLDDFSIKAIVPHREFQMGLGWEMQPYNHYIFMYGYRNEAEGLYCYDVITEKFKKVDTGYGIFDFWIYDDTIFYISDDGNIFYATLPEELVNDTRFAEDSVIQITDPTEVADVNTPLLLNGDLFVYNDKTDETTYKINTLDYKKDTKKTIKEGNVNLLTTSDNWVYFKYYDEKDSIYRIGLDGSNEELYFSFSDSGINSGIIGMFIIGDNEFIIESYNDKHYHLSPDKTITEIES